MEPSDVSMTDVKNTMEIFAWIGGLITGFVVIVRTVVKAGEEKRRYEELREDLDDVKQRIPSLLTEEGHKVIQQQCWDNRDKMRERSINSAVEQLKEQLNTISGTLCYFMGKLNIEPPPAVTSQKRRKDDLK